MAKKKSAKSDPFTHLEKFLKQNKDVNFSSVNLADPASVAALDWKNLSRSKKKILEQLQGYQRLLNVVPSGHSDLVLAFLREHIHSALQIAAMPRAQFLTTYAHLTKDEQLLATCFDKALAIRSKLLLHYVNQKQQLSTP